MSDFAVQSRNTADYPFQRTGESRLEWQVFEQGCHGVVERDVDGAFGWQYTVYCARQRRYFRGRKDSYEAASEQARFWLRHLSCEGCR